MKWSFQNRQILPKNSSATRLGWKSKIFVTWSYYERKCLYYFMAFLFLSYKKSCLVANAWMNLNDLERKYIIRCLLSKQLYFLWSLYYESSLYFFLLAKKYFYFLFYAVNKSMFKPSSDNKKNIKNIPNWWGFSFHLFLKLY